jgi:hypothetical protein
MAGCPILHLSQVLKVIEVQKKTSHKAMNFLTNRHTHAAALKNGHACARNTSLRRSAGQCI